MDAILRGVIMRAISTCVLAGFLAAAAVVGAQAQTKIPKPAPPPAPKAAASGVDTVIALVKGGMSEALVIKTLQAEGKTHTLTTADLLKLQAAGVSEGIMHAMTEPKDASAATATAAAPAAAPAALAKGATAYPPDLADLPASRKRRLAVQPFDYSTVTTWVNYWFNNNTNIGEGIRAMLTVTMDKSRNITLLERTNIE